MPQTLAFSSSLETLKFSVHSTFETRFLFKIFDAEFPYKLSYFEPLCLPAKMAAENVIRPIRVHFIVSVSFSPVHTATSTRNENALITCIMILLYSPFILPRLLSSRQSYPTTLKFVLVLFRTVEVLAGLNRVILSSFRQKQQAKKACNILLPY